MGLPVVGALLLVLRLVGGFLLLTLGDLPLQILSDLGQNGKDPVVGLLVGVLLAELGVGGIVLGALELGGLLQEGIVLGVGRQGLGSLLQKGNSRGVVRLGLDEAVVGSLTVRLSLLHHSHVLVSLGLHVGDLILQLGLPVIELLDLVLQAGDAVVQVLVLVLLLGLLLNALVIVLPVLGLLIIQSLDHGVDALNDLIKVAPSLQSGNHGGQGGAAGGLGLLGQYGESLGAHRSEGVGVDLHERSHRISEQLAGVFRIQDLNGLINAIHLLIPQPGALCPLVGLVGAGLVRVLEELLVGGELLRGVLPGLDAHAQDAGGVGMLSLLLSEHPSVLAQLLVLVIHELLKELLLAGLVHHVVLHVHSEGVVHVLQDPLDCGRLRGVLGELGRVLEQGFHGLRVLVAQAGSRHHAHDGGEYRHQVTLAGARAGEQADSLLQGAHRLLHLTLLSLEGGVLLLAELGGLFLGRLSLLDVA
mmetsp:Transcript_34057/g.74427  ORF Transcript_34057/g.74427 Transcript_34057/m.74427 type:complete len:474 (-) Transcript_34057:346-1767(-)